ncbi:hypothetical protein HY641_04620 [Candidatus Woesearchaeota archaeon]|nr:hypothetical protein [Candidatus Woesearchaeota archaeon]
MAELLVRAIVEMLGKPKEHIEKTLKDYVAKLRASKVQILNEEFAKAKSAGQLFSAFVELEIRFKNLNELMNFCITSLPSSVEVIGEETLCVPASDLTSSLTDLQGHLHELDMILKNERAKNEIIDRNAVALFRNFILHLVSNKPHKIDELSKILGIKSEDLKPFLDRMVEMNLIKPQGQEYVDVEGGV